MIKIGEKGLSKSLKVCIIGCGSISPAHLNAYMEIPYAEVVACCSKTGISAKTRAKQYGIKTVYTNYKDALKDEEIDVVDICIPLWLHSKITIDALEAGKHVLCEKPMASSLDEADSMIKASKKAGVKFMIAHSERYVPLFAEAKKQIECGRIGDPIVIRVTHRWGNPIQKWHTPTGRAKYSSKYGGPIIDTGIHGFDLIRWYLKRDALMVYTEADTYPEPMPIFTQMNMTIEFDDAIGFVEVGRTTRGYPSHDRILDVIGSEGSIRGFDNSFYTVITRKPSEKTIIKLPSTPTAYTPFTEKIPYPSEFKLEIADFLSSILEDKPVPVPPEESRVALEIALAAQKSGEDEKVVKLPLK